MSEPFAETLVDWSASGVTTLVMSRPDAVNLSLMLIHIGKGGLMDEKAQYAMRLLGTRIALGK